MGSLLFDLRHAARTLVKAPVFTAVTVLTLALGIGANSAMFSLVNAALLAPMGFADADRLVMIHEGIPQAGMPKIPASVPDIVDLEALQQSFSGLGVYRGGAVELSGRGEPRRLATTRVSASLFPLLGVEPMLGRHFTEQEDTPGHDVAILSYAAWQSIFNGSPEAVGATVSLDRRPFTVVGVMPASFEFPRRGPQFNAEPADLWTPIAFNDFERQARGSMFNNSVIARLKPGVALEQAQRDVAALGPRIREHYPVALRNSPYQLTIAATPLRDEIAGQVQTPLLVLFAAVGLVLLVACANVANLILSRAATRRHELAMRLALGASRTRLLQLLLSESALLAAAGAALGLVAGRLFLAGVPAVLAESLPGVRAVELDVRVVAFTIGVSILTALVFGFVPMFTSDRHVGAALHEGGARTAGSIRGLRVQRVLVTATVSLAVLLLVGAGLLVRSFTALVATDPGFQPHQVLSMSVTLPARGYPGPDRIAAFTRRALEEMLTLPGVRAATVSTDLPLESNERRAFAPDAPVDPSAITSVAVTWTHGEFFRTLGVPLRRGRFFTREEDAAIRRVAIVSESLAARYWPGQDAVGKRIKWGLPDSKTPWMTIVGVVGDVHDGPLGSEPTIHAYVPMSEFMTELRDIEASQASVALRLGMLASGSPAALAQPAREVLARIDPALAVTRIATMSQQVAESVAPQRFSAMAMAGFAAGALLLAAIGLYGVLAFAVAQRTREIGVRIALGATRAAVLGMVVRQGMALVVAGLAIGLAAAAAATRVMSALLYETTPHDPWTFAAAPIVLAAVALLACYLPARRAARVEPVVALRAE
jgi:putative ABC transport system permease protein